METDLPLSFLPYTSIPMSLIMREPGRCLCQRAKPYALSWKPWDIFILSMHPDKFLTHICFGALLSCI